MENNKGFVDKVLLNKLKFSIDDKTLTNLRNKFGKKNVWLSI